MIFSLYIHPNGVWLVPDNLAWLTVSILLILPATGRPPTIPYFACSGLVLLIAVSVRQPNIWLASIPWATGLSYLLFTNFQKQKKLFCIGSAILCTVPAFLLLWYFYSIWGGLVPPTVQARHERSLSYCVPPFFFSIFFVYSIFYAPILFSAVKGLLNRRAYSWIASGALLGFLIAVFPATDYNWEQGRFSGFWNFIRLAPTIGHTSVLLIITSSLGGAVFFSWLLLLKKEFRVIIFFSSLAFTLALIPNALVLERYFAGFVFILMFTMLYHTDKINWKKLPASVLIGPAVFTLINLYFLYRGIFPGT